MPRKLRYCPLSLTARPPSLVATPEGAAESKMDVVRCIGPECELWQFEVGGDPLENGDCSFVISAQALSYQTNIMRQQMEAARVEAARAATVTLDDERGN